MCRRLLPGKLDAAQNFETASREARKQRGNPDSFNGRQDGRSLKTEAHPGHPPEAHTPGYAW